MCSDQGHLLHYIGGILTFT